MKTVSEICSEFIDAMQKIALMAEEGHMNSLDAYLIIKNQFDVLEQIKEKSYSFAINEAQKYPKTFDYKGYQITRNDGRKTYDYKNVSAVKTVSEYLNKIKTISEMGGGVDPETGEVIEAAIPKFGKESLTIKIKK